jgi:hypothetical protein
MSDVDEGNNPPPESNEVAEEKQAEDDAESFLERETQRRQQSLKLYLALLAIPVALGIVVLIFGRSDRRLVLDEIRTQAPPLVQREVGEQLKPTIKSEVQTQISPTLGEIDGLKTRQTQIEEVSGSLKTLQAETTATLRKDNEAFKSEVKSELRTLSGVNEKLNGLDALNERLNSLERQELDARLRDLATRLRNLENRVKMLEGREANNGNQIPQPRKTP